MRGKYQADTEVKYEESYSNDPFQVERNEYMNDD